MDNAVEAYRAQGKEPQTPNRKKKTPTEDQVILSREAKELQAATDGKGRIARVKSLIEKGQYRVDSKLVAEKMIQRALEKERM